VRADALPDGAVTEIKHNLCHFCMHCSESYHLTLKKLIAWNII
jgi:hypothetical protein